MSYHKGAVAKHIRRYAGYQAYLSNQMKETVTALQVYQDKDVVEKGLDDFNNALDMKRLRMHAAQTVDGRLLVQFIALIYMSALRNELRKSKLISKYNTHELLDEMKTITIIT